MKKNKGKNNPSQTRPPVIVVLGHVDHGKSSLLEAIKDLKITGSESGGITQHIGAYMISHKEEKITFIDTPGHEAFFEMRSRGAKVADVGVLVVAADEGVKEQTKEAIKHLKDMKVPFLVVINKIDKKNIDIERVKQELAKEEIIVESYGGDIPSVNVSAKEKKGIDELLEMIILLAEMEDLKKEEEGLAQGTIIEVQKDPKKGVVATFLVQKGTLQKGDIIGTRGSCGRIRAMEDFQGKEVGRAEVSMPVQIIGLKGNLKVGERFSVFQKLNEAKKEAEKKEDLKTEKEDSSKAKETLNIILKVDVIGSLEAIEDTIAKIPQSKINIKIARADIGGVTESDVECAKAVDAKIFAFRVEPDKAAQNMAIREDIEIEKFDIIYELFGSVKENARKKLGKKTVKKKEGKIKVLAIFRTQRDRQILGGKVMKGEIAKGLPFEGWREEEKVAEGKIINVKKEEKDMERIQEGEEFGMLVESKGRMEEGDIIIPYKKEEIKEELEE